MQSNLKYADDKYQFGENKYAEEKVDFLHEALNDGYEDFLFSRDVPVSAGAFVKAQFQRLDIQVPAHLELIYWFGLCIMIDLANNFDPYLFFCGQSGVEITKDWEKYHFKMKSFDGAWKDKIISLDPEHVETYKETEKESVEFFDKHILIPSTKAFPTFISASIEAYLDGLGEIHDSEYEIKNFSTGETKRLFIFNAQVMDFLLKSGVPPEHVEKALESFYDLSIWAATMWLFSPLSKEYKMENDIFETCFKKGSCIIYQGAVFSPDDYSVSARPRRACYQCGIDAWCVEKTYTISGDFEFICEGCLTEELPKIPFATCGSKLCKFVECPHHEFFHDKDKARFGHGPTMRKHLENRRGFLGASVARKQLS
jgi:hypothetical protein